MKNLDNLFFVNVGPNGTFEKSGEEYTTPKDVEDIFNFLIEKDIEKLLIYFHGGLVSEKNGMKAARLMKRKFADESSKRHIISFVWETGPIETIVQNLNDLKHLSEEDIFQEITKFIIKLVARKLGWQDSKGSGVYLSDSTIDDEKSKLIPFENLDIVIGSKGGINLHIDNEDANKSQFYAQLETASKNLIKAEGSIEIKNPKDYNDGSLRGGFLVFAKVIAQIAFEVLKRYTKNTHHDFYPTIIEESFRKLYLDKGGFWGWNQMKEKSREMFQSNYMLSGDAQYAGTFFLSLLEKHCQYRSNAKKKFEVELIGHSAGSIAICNLLEATEYNFPHVNYNNIFFLAPACRADLFLKKGKLAKEKGVFKNFKMFTMEENNEKNDHCIPLIYTHSLLYLVSGLFEEEVDAKIMGLHEQFKAKGRYANFDELRELNSFINANKLVLSEDVSNPDESMRSKSLKHGDFDNDCVTLESILKSIYL